MICSFHVVEFRPVRSAMSVTEVVIAATLVSVLSVTGMTAAMFLMSAEQQIAESLVIERTIASLAGDLRRDAHAATSVETAEDDETTFSLLDGTTVTYEPVENGVRRREQNAAGESIEELYHLPFGSSQFEVSDSEHLVRWRHEREIPLTMSLTEPPEPVSRPRRAYRIEAALIRVATSDAGRDPVPPGSAGDRNE